MPKEGEAIRCSAIVGGEKSASKEDSWHNNLSVTLVGGGKKMDESEKDQKRS